MFSKKPPRWIISTIKTLILSMVVPLLSALPIFVPEVAQAATVGSGLCAQTVGSATGVTATQSGNDCIVTFTNAATTTWTAPNYLANLRYLVVAGGASGDRGQCSYYWGHGGGGGQVKDSTMSPVGGTAYTVTVGAGGGPTGGCTNAPNGNPGGNSVFASVTSQGGYAATATSYVGGTSGAGYAGGTGLSANLGGGGGGGAGGAGSVLNGGIGVTSNISGSTLMYGAGGAGKDNVGYGTAYGTDGVAVTNAGTEPPANTGMGGTDKAGWAVSTSGASGIVILRYQAVYNISFNANGGTGSATTTSTTTNLGSQTTISAVGTLARTGYTFAGWSTSVNGTGTVYASGSTFYPGQDYTFYAIWKSTLTYDPNTATQPRAIESTTALTSQPVTTLSNGKLVPGKPISSGLVFNMNAADSSSVVGSTWYDASRNGVTASLVNGPAYNAKDGYFTLDNTSSQYMSLGTSVVPTGGSSAYSLSVMFKADKPNEDNKGIISRYNLAGGSSVHFILRQRSNSTVQYWNSGYGDLNGASAFNEGDINYATITNTGSLMTIYINGNKASVATSASYSTTLEMLIGALGTTGNASYFWSGRIYSVQGYNRALSETEVALNNAAMMPNQLATKTGFTLVGWNTAPDGSGTSATNTAVDLAALPTPYARLLPGNYTSTGSTTGTWNTTVGTTLSLTTKGTPTYNASSGRSWGATASFPTLSGGTADGIRLNNPTLTTFTLCAVTRYKDVSGVAGSKGRLLASSTLNWFSGYYNGNTRQFHHEAWNYDGGTTDTDWHYHCDTGNRAFWDGTPTATWTKQVNTSLPPIAINYDYYGQNSDWEIAEVIIYDQFLTVTQVEQINRYFKNTYGFSAGATTSAAALATSNSTYASTGDKLLYAQWGSTITYDGDSQTAGRVPAPTVITGTSGTLATNSGSLAKAGFRFDGWNTAADGSGTNYPAGGTYPNTGNITLYAQWTIPTIFPTNIGYVDPAALAPYMRFKASDYDPTTKTWRDSSGNGRSTSLITGTPTLETVTGNGSNKSMQVVQGTISTTISFNNPQLSNYTLFNIARYSGANKQRILVDPDGYGLFGFSYGYNGIAYHNGWVTQYGATQHTQTDWVLSTDYYQNYRSNGASRTTSAAGEAILRPVGINIGSWDSDYQVAEVLIFDRTLSLAEIQLVEDYLANYYGLTGVVQSKSYPNPKTYYVGAGAGGGLKTETFTATQGLGKKSFTISPTIPGITLDNTTLNGTSVVISTLAAIGTYLETITATDLSGATSTFQVNLVVTPYTKFDTSTATSISTSYGVSKTLRLNTVQGIGTRVFSFVTNPLNHFTLDTSTAGSNYATLGTTGFIKPGTYTVVVGVTDSTTVRSTYTISVTVNQSPLITYPNGTVSTFKTSNLLVNYDITNVLSYSGTETRVADLAGTTNSTFQGTIGYSGNYGGYLDIKPGNYLQMTTCQSSIASSTMSYFLWINPRANGVVIGEGNSGWLASTIDINNGAIRMRVYNGTSISYTLPSLNRWYYVGLTYGSTKFSMYVNGVKVGSNTTTRSTTSANCLNVGQPMGGSANMGVTTGGDFLFGAMHVYNATLNETEVAYNYEATQKYYLTSTLQSGSYSINTTAGFAADYSLFTATLGTGNKTFGLSPTVTGITLDTSTANTAILKLGTNIASTNSTTAAVYTETMTATDSVTGVTKYDLLITVNPAITITPTIATTLSTTFGTAVYDTFTAAYGTGTKTLSEVSSDYASAFTISSPSANVGVLAVAANLPVGTYTDTITALDAVGATTNYVLTVIVNPAPTIAGNPTNTLTTTVTKAATLRIEVLNGTGTRRLTYTSPNPGITIDSSTITSNYVTLKVETTTPVNTFTFNVTVIDSVGATNSGSFTVLVNRWPVIGAPSIVSADLKLNLDGTTYSGSGAWLDSSGNGKNAVLGSQANLVKTDPTFSTNSGGVFSFNETTSATTNYAQVASPGSFETFTVSLWAKFKTVPASGSTTEAALITEACVGTCGKINFALSFTGAQIRARWFTGGGTGTWSTDSPKFTPIANAWYNVAYSVYKSGSLYYSELFVNGTRVGPAVQAGTTAPGSAPNVLFIGRRWNGDEFINGQIGGVLIYSRALSDAEILQNFNAQGARFLATNSGTTNYATTEGINSSLTSQSATDGTSTKTFTLAPTVAGISLDTSTANSYVLNIASTVAATDSVTARTIYETVTATDAAAAQTALAYKFTINPAIQLAAPKSSLTTTSSIAAWDTITATYGTGNKTFALTGSPTTTGFTLTQANNVAVLKVEPTANPGTYYETITATDEVGATKTFMVTILVRPAPTILGPNTLISAKGVAFRSPAYAIVNGSPSFRYSLASKALAPDTNTVTGITWDTATMTINVAANVGSGTYVETLTVFDTYSATSYVLISLTVKDPISITGGSLNITKTYGDLYQQSYFINNLTSAVGFRTTVGTDTEVCVPIVGTIDSSTYEMLTSIGSCSWIAPSTVSTVDYVVVGGGGSGGISRGGGGGGGGVAIGTGMTVTAGASHQISIGAGGSGQTNGKANSGVSSYIINAASTQFLATAGGGGGGGSMSTDSNISFGISTSTPTAAAGVSASGSGGGGAPNFWNGNFYYTEGGTAGTGGTVSGYKGGNSYRCDSSTTKNDGSVSGSGRTTGGGGGAGGEGVGYVSGQTCPTYNINAKPNGGIGVTTTITGQTLYLGGGGGGSDGRSVGGAEYSYSSTGRGVGTYGGGDGEQVYVPGGISAQTPDTLTALAATSGAANTGGGGGGGINAAGTGGSGVAILKYLTPARVTNAISLTTISNGSASTSGQVLLTIPENVTAGVTSKVIKVSPLTGSPTTYTVNITINKATPTISVVLPGNVTTGKYGNTVTLYATASTAGQVAFKDNGTVITGCSSVATESSTATCAWTPSSVATHNITAVLTPTDSVNYETSTVTSSVVIGKADTLTVTAGNVSVLYNNGSAITIAKPFTYSDLVSIDTLTAVGMIYTGIANDSSTVNTKVGPTVAGTFIITPDTSVAQLSSVMTNYVGVTLVPGTLTVNRIAPTLSLAYATANTVVYAPNLTVDTSTATRSGTGLKSFTSSSLSNCTVDSATARVSVLKAGYCYITMDVDQSPNFLAGSILETLTVTKATRTITLSAPVSTLKYTETTTVTVTLSGGTDDGALTFALNSTPGCTIDALSYILTATSGTLACTLRATIGTGDNYESATVVSPLAMTISRANAPTITIDTVTAVNYNPGTRASIVPSYSITGFKGTDAASSMTLTYSFVSNPFETFAYSDTRTPIDAGTYRITPSAIVMSSGLLSNYETPSYSAAAITFTINRIAQDSVTITNLNGEIDVPYFLNIEGGNNPGGALTYNMLSGTCTLSTNRLDAASPGTCVISVTLAGNRNYLPATSDSMTVSIRNYTRYTIIIPSNPNTGITLGHVTQIESGTVLAPVITLITPDSGRVGDLVVITGSHFTGATRVIFNVFYDSANFNVDSDTQITAEIPVGVTPTALDGVDVITPGGPSMRFYDFTILP